MSLENGRRRTGNVDWSSCQKWEFVLFLIEPGGETKRFYTRVITLNCCFKKDEW